MRKTIQIGNLDYSVDARVLGQLFIPYGPVYGARVSTHHDTGQSTGVGFVEMESGAAAESAIAKLNGRMHFDRILAVCWGKPVGDQDATNKEMFGPMNIADVAAPLEKTPERRGLPQS